MHREDYITQNKNPKIRKFVLVPIAFVLAGWIAVRAYAIVTEAKPPTSIQLSCGDGYDTQLDELVSGGKVKDKVVINIPGGCWTTCLVRPRGTPMFWWEVSNDLDIQKYFANGEVSLPEPESPLLRNPENRPLTGVRFRSKEPTRILIRLAP